MLPLPFTRTYIRGGAPIHVPPDLSREELEPYRLQVQQAMDELKREVHALAGRAVENWPECSDVVSATIAESQLRAA